MTDEVTSIPEMGKFKTMEASNASSKDTPLQRTMITFTSEKILFPSASGGDESGTIPLTLTRTRTETISFPNASVLPTTITSNTTLSSDVSSLTRTGTTTGTRTTVAPEITEIAVVSPSHSGGVPRGAIAGIVAGTALALAAIGAIVWLFARRRKKREEDDDYEPSRSPVVRSFRVLNQPQLAELDHNPQSHPPQAPPELGHWSVPSSPSDPRQSTWQGVQSPSPKPAVAEVESYTRAWRKPRVYDIGSRVIVELPGENASNHEASPEGAMPSIISTDGTQGVEALVSPLSPDSSQGTTPTWGGQDKQNWTRRDGTWNSM